MRLKGGFRYCLKLSDENRLIEWWTGRGHGKELRSGPNTINHVLIISDAILLVRVMVIN